MDGDSPTTFKGFTLAPFQRQAAKALDTGHNVLVAAPTGAGKTLVAEYAIHLALAADKRVIYTAPIKALSNQKFRDFREDPEIQDAGLMTGDVTVRADARVLVMTTEILRNTLFEDPSRLHDVGAVVFDEVHYLDDPERGSVWEETLLFLPETVTVVGLSATVSNLDQFAAWLEEVRNRPVEVVEETHRPVPLRHFLYHPAVGTFGPKRLKSIRKKFGARKKDRNLKRRNDDPLIREIVERECTPVLYFCFSRKLCEIKARKTARKSMLTPDQRRKVAKIWAQGKSEFDFEDASGPMRALKDMVHQGVAAHHAGMLPLHKEMVERLFTAGLLVFLYTTETFALGINMPARAVVFDSLAKFNGVEFDWMRTRDFLQMAGRAGRQGMDEEGLVYTVLEFDDVFDAPVQRIFDGTVEPVMSRFGLDYGALVHLHGVAGKEGALNAWERSFAAFQARDHSPRREEERRKKMRKLVGRRMGFLENMGYIRGDREILPRGRTATGLHGHPVELTELLFEGVLDQADPAQLCGVVGAVIHEGRRRETWLKEGLRPMRVVLQKGGSVLDQTVDAELDAGLHASLKTLDPGMSPALHAYSRGKDFRDLEKYTSASPGDFVRTARIVVQSLRHLRKVAGEGWPELASLCTEAVDSIWRGPVDVKAELGLTDDEKPE